MPSTLSIPAHRPWRHLAKGSDAAKAHMAELRAGQLQTTKTFLINEWVRVTGRPRHGRTAGQRGSRRDHQQNTHHTAPFPLPPGQSVAQLLVERHEVG